MVLLALSCEPCGGILQAYLSLEQGAAEEVHRACIVATQVGVACIYEQVGLAISVDIPCRGHGISDLVACVLAGDLGPGCGQVDLSVQSAGAR